MHWRYSTQCVAILRICAVGSTKSARLALRLIPLNTAVSPDSVSGDEAGLDLAGLLRGPVRFPSAAEREQAADCASSCSPQNSES